MAQLSLISVTRLLASRRGNFGTERDCPAAIEHQRNFACVMSSAVGSPIATAAGPVGIPTQASITSHCRRERIFAPAKTDGVIFWSALFETGFGSHTRKARVTAVSVVYRAWHREVKDIEHDIAGRAQHASRLGSLLLTEYRIESPELNRPVSSTPSRHHRQPRLMARAERVPMRRLGHATNTQGSKYGFGAESRKSDILDWLLRGDSSIPSLPYIMSGPLTQQLGCSVRCQDSILDPAFSGPVAAEHSWRITATDDTSGSKIFRHSDVEQHLQDKTSLTEAGHNYAESRQVRCYWSEAPSNTCALYLSVIYARFLPTVYMCHMTNYLLGLAACRPGTTCHLPLVSHVEAFSHYPADGSVAALPGRITAKTNYLNQRFLLY
ncbi:hypothetical protein LA080_006107 [Diaporthe eres]|nr:hypothetical protein LA080_006107 [Diaporthe eres]